MNLQGLKNRMKVYNLILFLYNGNWRDDTWGCGSGRCGIIFLRCHSFLLEAIDTYLPQWFLHMRCKNKKPRNRFSLGTYIDRKKWRVVQNVPPPVKGQYKIGRQKLVNGNVKGQIEKKKKKKKKKILASDKDLCSFWHYPNITQNIVSWSTIF